MMMLKRKEQDQVVEKLRTGTAPSKSSSSSNNNHNSGSLSLSTSPPPGSNDVVIDSLQQQQSGNFAASSSLTTTNNNHNNSSSSSYSRPPQTAPSPASTSTSRHNQHQQQTQKLVSSSALRRGDPLMNHYVALPTSNHEALTKLFTQAEVPEEAERLQKIVVPGELFAAAEYRAEQSEEKFNETFGKLQQSEYAQTGLRQRISDLEGELSRVNAQSNVVKEENNKLLDQERKDKERIRDLIAKVDEMKYQHEETEKKLHEAEKYVSELQQKNVGIMAKSARLRADVENLNDQHGNSILTSRMASANPASMLMSMMLQSVMRTNSDLMNNQHPNRVVQFSASTNETNDSTTSSTENPNNQRSNNNNSPSSAQLERSTLLTADNVNNNKPKIKDFKGLLTSMRDQRMALSSRSSHNLSRSSMGGSFASGTDQNNNNNNNNNNAEVSMRENDDEDNNVFTIEVTNLDSSQRKSNDNNTNTNNDETRTHAKNNSALGEAGAKLDLAPVSPLSVGIDDTPTHHNNQQNNYYQAPAVDPLLLIQAVSEFEEKYKQKCRELAQLRVRAFARDANASRHILALRKIVDDGQNELSSYKRRFARTIASNLSASQCLTDTSASSKKNKLAVSSMLEGGHVDDHPDAIKELTGNNKNNANNESSIRNDRYNQSSALTAEQVQKETQRLPTPPTSWGQHQNQKEMKEKMTSLTENVDENDGQQQHNTGENTSNNVLNDFVGASKQSPTNRSTKGHCTSRQCRMRKHVLKDQLAVLEQEMMSRFDFDAVRGQQQKAGGVGGPKLTLKQRAMMSSASFNPSATASPSPPPESRASTRMDFVANNSDENINNNNRDASTSEANFLMNATVVDASINPSLQQQQKDSPTNNNNNNNSEFITNNLDASASLRSNIERSMFNGNNGDFQKYKKSTSLGQMLTHLEEATKYTLLLGSESMPEAHNAGRVLHSNRMLYSASTAIVDGAASFLSGAETAVTALTTLEAAVFGSKTLQEARIRWASAREQAKWVDSLGTHVDAGAIALRDSLVELRCYAKKKHFFGHGEQGDGAGGAGKGYLIKKPSFLMTEEEKKHNKKERRRRKKLKRQRKNRLKPRRSYRVRSLGGGDIENEGDGQDDEDDDGDSFGSVSSFDDDEAVSSLSGDDDSSDDDNFTGSGKSNNSSDDEEEAALDFKTFKLAHNIHNVIREFELEFLRQKSGGVPARAEFRSYAGAHHASDSLFSAANREQALAKSSKVYDNTPEGIYRLMHDTAGKLRLTIPLLVNFVKSFPRWDQIAVDGSDELQKLIKQHQDQQTKQFGPASPASTSALSKKIMEQRKEAERAEIFRQEILSRSHPRWKMLLDRLMTFTKKIDAQKLKNKDGASSWRLDKQRQRREQKEKEKIAKQAIKLMEETHGSAMFLDESTGNLVPVASDGSNNNNNNGRSSGALNNLRKLSAHFSPKSKNLPPVVARLYPNYRPKFDYEPGEQHQRRPSTYDHNNSSSTSQQYLFGKQKDGGDDGPQRDTSFYRQTPPRFQQKEAGPQAAMQRWLARRKQVLGGYQYVPSGRSKSSGAGAAVVGSGSESDQQYHHQPVQHRELASSLPPKQTSISPSRRHQPETPPRSSGTPQNQNNNNNPFERFETAVYKENSNNDSNAETPRRMSRSQTPQHHYSHQQQRRESSTGENFTGSTRHHLQQENNKLQQQLLHVQQQLSKEKGNPLDHHLLHQNQNQQPQKVIFSMEDIETANPEAIRALITKAGGVGEVSKVLRNSLRDEQSKTDKLQREVLFLKKSLEQKAAGEAREENQVAKVKNLLQDEQYHTDRLKRELSQSKEEMAHLRYQLEKMNKQFNRGTFSRVKSFTIGDTNNNNSSSPNNNTNSNSHAFDDVAPMMVVSAEDTFLGSNQQNSSSGSGSNLQQNRTSGVVGGSTSSLLGGNNNNNSKTPSRGNTTTSSNAIITSTSSGVKQQPRTAHTILFGGQTLASANTNNNNDTNQTNNNNNRRTFQPQQPRHPPSTAQTARNSNNKKQDVWSERYQQWANARRVSMY